MSDSVSRPLLIRQLGRQPYLPVLEAMQRFTDSRDATRVDELWLVEHDPVFTQGQAGKPEHLLAPGDIPVVRVDRGGQVTYHGPGQLVVYLLLDLRRLGLGVRELVTLMEQALVELLAGYGIDSYPKADAPGVYVKQHSEGDAKIASLGLRIRRGCSFHGLALNVDMDLSPFLRINPCGYAGLSMTQMIALANPQQHSSCKLTEVGSRLQQIFTRRLGYDSTCTTPQLF
ncbi:MAG: lipoyl(octanoyl) transferase [Motiliproteus sp.]|jgi:lipoyl(octanoyl) transferase